MAGSVKTGDVLIMYSDSLYDNCNFTSYWLMEILQYNIIGNVATHTGLVVVYDKPYIYHMTAYPKWDDYHGICVYNGPVYQDLYKYIYGYCGYVGIMQADTEKSICSSHNLKYSINPLNWLVDLNLKTQLFTKNGELYCYEFVAYLLQMPNYRNISAGELISGLGKMGYIGPYLYENAYKDYLHLKHKSS
jgi:hypothetical protein